MDCRAVVAAGLFRVGGPFTGRERYRTNLVLESRKARGLKCPGIQDVEGCCGCSGRRSRCDPCSRSTRSAGRRPRERENGVSLFSRHGRLVRRSVGDQRTSTLPAADRTKNRKKCDETAKKRGELVTGAFFEPKKRGGTALSAPLRCCSVRPCGEWVLQPTPASAQGAFCFADSRPSERTSRLGCLSGHRCRRRGRVKIFHRGSNFYLTPSRPQLGCN